jgi:hypothetical protein
MTNFAPLISISGSLQLLAFQLSAATANVFWLLWLCPVDLQPICSLKATQQIVNFLITIAATSVDVLSKDCLR